MPVTLRKRAAPPAEPERPAKKAAPKEKKPANKAVESVKAAATKAKGAVTGKTNGASPAGAPEVGDSIDIDNFGGEFETQDGKQTTMKELLAESKAGVVLFTYPKASTPGCTTQACLFRDGYSTLTSSGLSIYGLSGDSAKANTTFKTKHSFPYDLLCNPSYSLIGAIGMQDKPAKKTKRGVFVVSKDGKVLAVERGGPQATVDVVKGVVDKMGAGGATIGGQGLKGEEGDKEDEEAAETAGEVADAARAAHLDATPLVGTPA